MPLSHTKSGYFPAPVQMPEGDEQVVDFGCGHFHAFARTGTRLFQRALTIALGGSLTTVLPA